MSSRHKGGNADDVDPLERRFSKSMRARKKRMSAFDDAAAQGPESELADPSDEELEAIERENEENGL